MQIVRNTYWDAEKGNLAARNTTKPFGGRCSAPDHAGRAYSAPANPYLVGRGWLPLPQEPHPPRSALRASPLLTPYSKISSDAVGPMPVAVTPDLCDTVTVSQCREKSLPSLAKSRDITNDPSLYKITKLQECSYSEIQWVKYLRILRYKKRIRYLSLNFVYCWLL